MAILIVIYGNHILQEIYKTLNVWIMRLMALNWNKENYNVINKQRNDRNTGNQARTKPE